MLGVVVFFGLGVYVLWCLGGSRAWTRLVGALAVLATLGVAYSRLYANAHWTTDVLGGVAAGGAFLCVTIVVMDRVLAGAQVHPDRADACRTVT